MKLFTKYTRVNLLATIVIFLLSVVAFYFAIRFIVIDQVDSDLRIEEREIETYVKEHNALPEPIPVKDQKISYVPIRRSFSQKEIYNNCNQGRKRFIPDPSIRNNCERKKLHGDGR